VQPRVQTYRLMGMPCGILIPPRWLPCWHVPGLPVSTMGSLPVVTALQGWYLWPLCMGFRRCWVYLLPKMLGHLFISVN
jgi:hypothetical protein